MKLASLFDVDVCFNNAPVGMMGSGQEMGMGQGKGPQARTGDMMPMHQMMEERMQMMMEQMMQREEMRDATPQK